MPYKLKSEDAQKIVFERAGTGCNSLIFGGAGAVILLVGIVMNLVSSDLTFPYLFYRTFVPVFGLGALTAGILLPRWSRKWNPHVITFDNAKGAVVIEMTKDGGLTGYIRYDEIEKFDIYHETRSTDTSASTTLNNSTKYYHVLVRKKDGGEWFLTESSTRAKAEEILQKVIKGVQLGNPGTRLPASTLTDKLSKEDKGEKTEIRWKNEVPVWTPFFLLIFAGFFLGGLGIGFASLEGLGLFIVGFMLIVFCIVMYSVVKKMIKDATTGYGVSVGKSDLEYFEFSKSTGAIKSSVVIPLQEINRISYSFSTIKDFTKAGLQVLTDKDQAYAQYTSDKPFEALKDLVRGNHKPIQLSITALNPVECLQLENWLQELIQKKSNIKII